MNKLYILKKQIVYTGKRMNKTRISLDIETPILQAFDKMVKDEGWGSRQEALVFLIQACISRGYISKERYEILKGVKSE